MNSTCCLICVLLPQIHSPDEFDMMLKLQAPSLLTMTKLDGGLFYRLDLNRPTRSPIQAFLLENQLTISSSKILNAMYELVRKFLKTYTGCFFIISFNLFRSITKFLCLLSAFLLLKVSEKNSLKQEEWFQLCWLCSSFPVPDKQFCWKVNRKRPTSPAVTLSLCRIGNNTDELMSVDLVPALMVIILSVHLLNVMTDQSEQY